MSVKKWTAAAVVLLALVALGWVVTGGGLGDGWGGGAVLSPAASSPGVALASASAGARLPAGHEAHTVPDSASAPTQPALGGSTPLRFELDRQGKLSLTPQTRNQIERLTALNTREAVQATLRELASALPPTAHRQLVDEVYRYEQYTAALSQALPPSQQAPVNEDEALKQLTVLHNLRVEHFGADTAAAFFGNEEATSKQLIELMRVQNDPGLTLAQKAERAQEALSKIK